MVVFDYRKSAIEELSEEQLQEETHREHLEYLDRLKVVGNIRKEKPEVWRWPIGIMVANSEIYEDSRL